RLLSMRKAIGRSDLTATMSRRQLQSAALVTLCWLYSSCAMASDQLSRADQILPTTPLRAHPRLLVSAEQFARLRTRIESDPLLRRVYESERNAADATLAQPALRYQKQGIRLLGVSRAALAR